MSCWATNKHLDEKMQPATLVALSLRRAMMEVADSLPRYTNIMLRLETGVKEEGLSELYAKVLRPVDGSPNRYLIHFTSAPPGTLERLLRIARTDTEPKE